MSTVSYASGRRATSHISPDASASKACSHIGPNEVIIPSGSIKSIIQNENYDDDTGYIIEHHNNLIHVTFWAFTDDENIVERNVCYNSLDDLYNESKLFIRSSLIDLSLLHKSKYKMMCDFVKYYEA